MAQRQHEPFDLLRARRSTRADAPLREPQHMVTRAPDPILPHPIVEHGYNSAVERIPIRLDDDVLPREREVRSSSTDPHLRPEPKDEGWPLPHRPTEQRLKPGLGTTPRVNAAHGDTTRILRQEPRTPIVEGR